MATPPRAELLITVLNPHPHRNKIIKMRLKNLIPCTFNKRMDVHLDSLISASTKNNAVLIRG